MKRDSKFYIKIGMLINLGALIFTSHGMIFQYVIELNPLHAFLMANFGLLPTWITFAIFWALIYKYHHKLGEYLHKKSNFRFSPNRLNLFFAQLLAISLIPDLLNDLYVFFLYLSYIGLI